MWEVFKPNDSSDWAIRVDNVHALRIAVYYGSEANSDGMTEAEFQKYIRIMASGKEALEASLHPNFDTSYAKGPCQCPWCARAHKLLNP